MSGKDIELIVDARDLRKRYSKGVRAALDGVSLEVRKGELVAVLGPSGCGKSTLLGIIGGLDRSFSGRLELFGEDARKLSDVQLASLRGSRIGFVFQAFHLLGHLSALDNVLAPMLFVRDRKLDRKQLRRRAAELLAEVGLQGRGDDRPSHMSGGERQRLAIARAMLLSPQLLLCDEPTGNLDATTGAQVVDIFRQLHRGGLTIVAVTHEERLSKIATRIVRLQQGRVVTAEAASGSSARAEDESARAEDESARAEDESARAEDESARAEDESACAEDESACAEDESACAEEP